MSVPQPPASLEGHCSAINNNTLYVLSSDALQSLPLAENATWSQEPSGEAVKNPTCVTVASSGDAALYVIGGESTNSSYSGLQRYFFANKTWETLSPMAADVLQGRTNHSAAYLNDTQNILIYAGSQPQAPSTYSSQTFLLSTLPPFNLESYTTTSPPLTNPILQPWNSSHAVMAAGSPSNTAIWTFSQTDGFVLFGTSLTSPVGTSAKGVVVDGSDGSKVLQIFDFGVSPNTATNVVLIDASGQPATTGQTVGASNSTSAKRKRDLTLSNWPAYNSSNAPTATRADASIAQNPDGVVAAAGGNSDAPIILFNQGQNSWIDAGAFFNAASQQPLQPSSTPAASPTPAPSPPQTSSASTNPLGYNPADQSHKTDVALGAILGTIFGIIALFILLLLLLRLRKRKTKKGQNDLKEKEGNDRMSFADRGASYMQEAGVSNQLHQQPPAASRVANGHNNSHSSLAIMTGRANNIDNSKRNNSNHAPQGSYESTAQLVKHRNDSAAGEPVEMMEISDRRSSRSKRSTRTSRSIPTVPEAGTLAPHEDLQTRGNRSSGWSKYFATSQPTGPNGLSHLPSAYVKPNTLSMESDYSNDRPLSRIPSSALVPPLDIDFSKTIDGQRLSHVASGSPAFSDSREDLAKSGGAGGVEGQKALYVDSRKSQATSISSYGHRSVNRSTMSSTMTDYETHTPWTPMSSFKDHVNERPTSSVYTNSIYDSSNRKFSRGKGASGGFFPGAGTAYKPTKAKTSSVSDPPVPVPVTELTEPKEPAPAKTVQKTVQERASGLSVFPRGVPSAYYVGSTKGGAPQAESASQAKPVNTDMSWLNLGLSKPPV